MQITIESLKYLQKEENLKLSAYVMLENHLLIIVQSDDIAKSMRHFKSFTAKAILKLLQNGECSNLIGTV
jgi:uncharacterized ubiquitin-like protein YukD